MISPLGRPAEGIALLIARQLLKQWTPRALLGLVRAHTSRSVLQFTEEIQYVLGQTLTADLASLDCAASKTKSLAIDCLGQVPLTLSIFYGRPRHRMSDAVSPAVTQLPRKSDEVTRIHE